MMTRRKMKRMTTNEDLIKKIEGISKRVEKQTKEQIRLMRGGHGEPEGDPKPTQQG